MTEFLIKHFDEVTSTNTLAKDFAAQGAKDGLVVVSDYQSEGKGKPGNTWISPKGKNLLFSVLLRPSLSPSQAPILTQVVCRSIAKVLKDNYQIESTFKRPNDILVSGKKICGVLIEAASQSQDKVETMIVGVGLNVNSPGTDLLATATSMTDALKGKKIDRPQLLNEILEQFSKDIRDFYE